MTDATSNLTSQTQTVNQSNSIYSLVQDTFRYIFLQMDMAKSNNLPKHSQGIFENLQPLPFTTTRIGLSP